MSIHKDALPVTMCCHGNKIISGQLFLATQSGGDIGADGNQEILLRHAPELHLARLLISVLWQTGTGICEQHICHICCI